MTFGQVYDLSTRLRILDYLRLEKFPSWGEAVGWIVWYVGLFSGRRAGSCLPAQS
jgi:hypothetical protein